MTWGYVSLCGKGEPGLQTDQGSSSAAFDTMWVGRVEGREFSEVEEGAEEREPERWQPEKDLAGRGWF